MTHPATHRLHYGCLLLLLSSRHGRFVLRCRGTTGMVFLVLFFMRYLSWRRVPASSAHVKPAII